MSEQTPDFNSPIFEIEVMEYLRDISHSMTSTLTRIKKIEDRLQGIEDRLAATTMTEALLRDSYKQQR